MPRSRERQTAGGIFRRREPRDNDDGGVVVNHFIKHFVRERNGAWNCIEPAELMLPSGRVQVTAGSRFTPGTNFMGIDLAALLEEQYRKDGARPG